ncbi:Insecticidal toxin complex protein [Flavivirga sp. 57AJ16]|uniref:Insecticidal toxin complex protein n=1 Tax=Flavivirga sp. 57AJ16 TaxID=3025307 RepID=UPI002366770F|nr:Insecticidal toxin complex protein [Flavivirga sp. 57AJ16]MDD7887049.1 Insecticidal toxin complex protein [Flavivirga sp. 57AJ16]
MRFLIFILIIFLNAPLLLAKEWKSLRVYKKETQKETLSSSDWLKLDRVKNTLVWQEANLFNLKNNLPQEYKSISQRRDFYKWLFSELDKKEHEIIWVKMAHFISKKMHLMEVFPYSVFSKKDIRSYARKGSEIVFNNAFIELQGLYNSQSILKAGKALEWDRTIIEKEQYEWLHGIYKTMDDGNLKILERIAKGKFLYGLLVPKAIRFKGNLLKAEMRYNYAIEVLRPYCENRYK